MENNKLFLAVIDNPYSSEADFDYTACDTQEIAVNCLLEAVIESERGEKIYINNYTFDKTEGLIALKESLEQYHSALCNGIYYRIVPTVYLKEAQA